MFHFSRFNSDLSEINSNMAAFIDTSTLLHSITTQNDSWQATKDCWVTGFMGRTSVSDGDAVLYIDNVEILRCGASSTVAGGSISYNVCIPLKAGQTVKTRVDYGRYSLNCYAMMK